MLSFIKVLVGMLYFDKSPCKYALSFVKVSLGGLGFLKRCALEYDHLRGHGLSCKGAN